MPVNIRQNNRYRDLIHSLVQKNLQSDDRNNGHIKGIFSTLAKWRDRDGFEEAEVNLKRKFVQDYACTRARREIEAKWMRILLQMPKPKFLH